MVPKGCLIKMNCNVLISIQNASTEKAGTKLVSGMKTDVCSNKRSG